jgi:hypothetical protein
MNRIKVNGIPIDGIRDSITGADEFSYEDIGEDEGFGGLPKEDPRGDRHHAEIVIGLVAWVGNEKKKKKEGTHYENGADKGMIFDESCLEHDVNLI